MALLCSYGNKENNNDHNNKHSGVPYQLTNCYFKVFVIRYSLIRGWVVQTISAVMPNVIVISIVRVGIL